MPAASASAARRASAPAATISREKMASGRAGSAADLAVCAAVSVAEADGPSIWNRFAATTTHAMTTEAIAATRPGPLRRLKGELLPPWWGPASPAATFTHRRRLQLYRSVGWLASQRPGLRPCCSKTEPGGVSASPAPAPGAHHCASPGALRGRRRQTSIRIPSKHSLDLISAARPSSPRIRSRTGMDQPTVHHLISPAPVRPAGQRRVALPTPG